MTDVAVLVEATPIAALRAEARTYAERSLTDATHI